ncbi:hypothetical protein ANO11243_080270 [Dothideomycetidae sp. 11243]|nr:hypothetical protein ANO11243_080270 [fungal sp. No.11243]
MAFSIAPHLHPYQQSLEPPFDVAADCGARLVKMGHLVASAAVIHSGRILLLQRAAHSFQPLLWELPGGRCEPRDASIMASAVRELWEESGLIATEVLDVVGTFDWHDGTEVWRKFTFLVGVEHDDRDGGLPLVKLDPNEQNAFVWATEEEVVADKCGAVALDWTSEDQKRMVVNAFVMARNGSHSP